MGFFNSQVVTFQPFDEYVEAADSFPIPASSALPEWYKNLPRFVNNSDVPIKSLGRKDLKMCVPFRDAMISGYLYLLPCDIEIQKSSNGDIDFFHSPQLTFSVVEKRGLLAPENQGYGMPNPPGTIPIMFAWSALFGVGTTTKHSVLVTHPFNRFDLPFVTTSGIIDSDVFNKAGNIPFFIKEGFTGVIPKGTPIAQIFPYKRESWISRKIKANVKEYALFMTLRDTYLHSFYSRFFRQPKSYK